MRAVVYEADLPSCKCCGEPYCWTHNMHFADCDCIGPTEDDVVYSEINGVLWGERAK